jgi:hypothetical protein
MTGEDEKAVFSIPGAALQMGTAERTQKESGEQQNSN